MSVCGTRSVRSSRSLRRWWCSMGWMSGMEPVNRCSGQAKAGSHKLLLLSRPYGIEQERTLVDLEIEHVGLSDGQMQRRM